MLRSRDIHKINFSPNIRPYITVLMQVFFIFFAFLNSDLNLTMSWWRDEHLPSVAGVCR